jgi:predicted ATP-grasp superfamily ATP-dependent carboligase
MTKAKVLVFPCGTEIANEIFASLHQNKTFDVVLASSVSGTYCDFRGKDIHLLPYVTDEKFFDELCNLVKREQISYIFPAHDDAALVFSQLSEKIDAKIIGQSCKINEIVRYKDRTYDYFRNNLPIPQIYQSLDDVLTYPVFVKPKKGQGSFSAFPILNKTEAKRFSIQYDPQDFVIMEFLQGDEYTIDCFSDKGKLVYFSARTREKTTNGISVISFLVDDAFLISQFKKYAGIISESVSMHGVWFFQMKKDRAGNLKLLEIGPRVAGTMMLNRARGVNLVEMALYQSAGFDVSIAHNSQVGVGVGRALAPVFLHKYIYSALYVDFDDTLYLDDSFVNTDLIKLIFQCKNKYIPVHLITKNQKKNLEHVLTEYGLRSVFSSIIHLNSNDRKSDFMVGRAMLIDDSFKERKEAIEAGFYALSVDAVNVLFEQ